MWMQSCACFQNSSLTSLQGMSIIWYRQVLTWTVQIGPFCFEFSQGKHLRVEGMIFIIYDEFDPIQWSFQNDRFYEIDFHGANPSSKLCSPSYIQWASVLYPKTLSGTASMEFYFDSSYYQLLTKNDKKITTICLVENLFVRISAWTTL